MGALGLPFLLVRLVLWCGTGSPGTRLRECPPAAGGRLLLYFAASSTRHSRPASGWGRKENRGRQHRLGAWSVRCLTQRNKGGGLGAAQSGGHSRSRIPDDPGTRTKARTKKKGANGPLFTMNAKKTVRPSPAPAHPLPYSKSGCGSCCAPSEPPNHLRSKPPASPATSATPPLACPPSPPAPGR